MDRIIAILALAILIVFLGILGWFVPSPDLVCVILLTIGLVAYDFVTALRSRSSPRRD